MDKVTLARFWAKDNKHGPIHSVLGTCCWLWIGNTVCHGYGYFWLNGKNERAHRVSWLIKHGKWPTPAALHKCDVQLCIRPEHLFEGTHSDNMDDMAHKGRAARQYGSSHGNAKLTESDVLVIRQKYAAGTATQQQLADEYQLVISSIHYALKGGWKHV